MWGGGRQKSVTHTNTHLERERGGGGNGGQTDRPRQSRQTPKNTDKYTVHTLNKDR